MDFPPPDPARPPEPPDGLDRAPAPGPSPIRGKPLGRRAYGSIGHLPGSRRGAGDHGVPEGQGRICTTKTRDKHDTIIVQEKLDGSNVAVARIDGVITPLQRKGYLALSSPFEQHRLFAQWVFAQQDRFEFLAEAERLCGEWLAQAHGTRYALQHEPFVAFDLMRGDERTPLVALIECLRPGGFVLPRLISSGPPLSIDRLEKLLEPSAHGALDAVEGAVYRVERKGAVDFLAKYVRPTKVDGCYLPELSGSPPVWNWRPK